MKRVLSVIQTPTYGGPHNRITNLAPLMDARGFATFVCLPTECESGVERMTKGGVKVAQVPIYRMRKSFDPRIHLKFFTGFGSTIKEMKELMIREKIDVVQVCGLMGIHAGIAAKQLGIPVVWQLLGTFAPMPLRRLLVPLVNRCASVVMCTGQRTADLHPGLRFAGPDFFSFFPPVDLARFKRDDEVRSRVRAALGIGPDEVLIGTVGNRNRAKAHDVFVEMAKQISEKYKKARFLIKGELSKANEADYARQVMEPLKESGLLGSKTFQFAAGDLSVPEVLNAMDVFVLTSRNEGVPTALLEAMAVGLPVISTKVGSVAEVVDEGKEGYLVEVDGTDEFVDRVGQLLNDPESMVTMGANGSERAGKEFAIEVCANRHETAYLRALSVEVA